MSVMVINEDHYINKVYSTAGTHKLTMEEFDTPYMTITARTLVNAPDPDDIKKTNALQDKITLTAASARQKLQYHTTTLWPAGTMVR